MKSNLIHLVVSCLVACVGTNALAQVPQPETQAPAQTETPPTPAPETTPTAEASEPMPASEDAKLAEDLKDFQEFKRWREAQKKSENTSVDTPAAPKEPAPETAVASQQATRPWKFGIGYGAMTASRPLTFESSRFSNTTTTYKGTSEFDLKKANSIFIEARNQPVNAWGVGGGVKIEGDREIEAFTLSVSGATATALAKGNSAKFQFTTYYINTLYTWDQIYVHFGLNGSVVDLKDLNKSVTYRSETKGGFGAQAGVGFMATPNVAFELTSWSLGVNQFLGDDTYTFNFGDGSVSSTLLAMKLFF